MPANEVNLARRFINLANITGAGDWGRKNWGKERSIIVDAGFGGCGLCSFSRLGKYAEYSRSFRPKPKLAQTKEKELRFAFGNQKGLVSVASTVLPICVNGSFKPVRIRLIDGKTEFPPGLDIVRNSI